MAEQSSPAYALYQKLLNTRKSAGEREKLHGIWKALQAIKATGECDYSIATVGRNSQLFKGPRTQSIRNKQGAHFREIIEAFATENGGIHQRRAPRKLPLEEALSSITNRALRLEIELELQRAKRLQHNLDELSAAFKQLSTNPRSVKLKAVDVPRPFAEPNLSIFKIEIFEKFLASDWFEERMWSRDIDGSIVDNVSGVLVAPPGFCSSLEELINASGI